MFDWLGFGLLPEEYENNNEQLLQQLKTGDSNYHNKEPLEKQFEKKQLQNYLKENVCLPKASRLSVWLQLSLKEPFNFENEFTKYKERVFQYTKLAESDPVKAQIKLVRISIRSKGYLFLI